MSQRFSPQHALRFSLLAALFAAGLLSPTPVRADTVLNVNFTNLQLYNVACGSGSAPCVTPLPPNNINSPRGPYLYKNVITIDGVTVDAKVEITAVQNATLTKLDAQQPNPERFQPEISTTTSSGGYADIKFEFFDSQGSPVSLYNFAVTAVDVDGSGSLREFVEIGGFSTYVLDAGTELTVQTGTDGRARFLGKNTSEAGIVFSDTAAVITRFTAPAHSMTFRLGNTASSGSARQFSLAIGAEGGVFSNPQYFHAPSVSLATSSLAINQDEFLVTATFSQDVTGFDQNDVVLSNGSITSFTPIDGKVYQFTVKAAAEGLVSVRVPAAAARGVVGEIDNTISNLLEVHYDTTPPTAVTLDAEGLGNNRYLVTATFDEPVFGLVPSDIDVSPGSLVAGSFSGQDEVYSFHVEVPLLAVSTVSIPAGAATDAAQNSSLASAPLELPASPTITSPANNATLNNPRPTLSGSAPLGTTVTVSVGGNSLPPASVNGSGQWSVQVPAPLANGSYSATAVATLGGIASGPSDQRNFEIDIQPPTTSIVDHPAALVNTSTATFQFDSDDSLAQFECSLDGGPWQLCASQPLESYTIVGLGEGVHALHVRAVDEAGNRDPTPAFHVWEIKVSKPTPVVVVGPPADTGNPDATFVLLPDPPGTTYECNHNGNGWEDCTGVTVIPGDEGHNEVLIRATDPAGNTTDPDDDVSWEWTVDTTPPNTRIATGPNAYTSSTSANFLFESDFADVVSYECRLNGSIWVNCANAAGIPSAGFFDGLSEGQQTLYVRAVDHVGNKDQAPAEYRWTVDTTAPNAKFVDKPGLHSAATSPNFKFGSDDSDLAYYHCDLDGIALNPCADSAGNPVAGFYSNLSQGAHTLKVWAVDHAGNESAPPAEYSWNIDLSTPVPSITNNPPSLTNIPQLTLAFEAQPADSTFECNFNNAGWLPCTSPKTFTAVEGSNTVEIRATDSLGNTTVPGDYATWTWELDTVAPDTKIENGPDEESNSDTATFEFSSNDPSATFECQLDGDAWQHCAGTDGILIDPFENLGEGPHTLLVRAVDSAGNRDQTPVEYTWTVDLSTPTPSISGNPPSLTSNPEITLTFDADEPGVTFECNLNGAGWVPCNGTETFTGQEGANELLVRATDPASNTTAPGDEATFNWTVDTIAPETNIDSGPDLFANSDTASFVFSSDDPTATYECRLDTGSWATCAGQDGIPADLTNLSEGQHTLHVRAVDTAGNKDQTPAQYSWTVDLTAPTPSITGAPPALTSNPEITLTFDADEPGVTFECNLNGAGWVPCNGTETFTGVEGNNTLEVRATDPAGNTTAPGDEATFNWTVDTIAPETNIDSGPALFANSDTASFVFSSDDPTATYECRLDAGAWAACAGVDGIPADLTNLSEGQHTLHVRAVDAAGNKDQTPAQYSWTVDLTAPTPSITGAPPALTSNPEITLTFDADEPGVTFECNLNGAGWVPCNGTETFTGQEGANELLVRATDPAGNTTAPGDEATFNWTVDTIAPETNIDSGPDLFANSDTASFVFSSDDPTATYECRLDAGAWAACAGVDGIPADLTNLSEGQHTLHVRAVDEAGNRDQTPAQHSWTVDLTAPTPSITGAPPALTNNPEITLTFDADEPGVTFECNLNGAGWVPCNGTETFTGVEGNNTLEVRATDPAGNTTDAADYASWTWEVDTIAPETSIDSGPDLFANSDTASFVFSSDDPTATYECRLDGSAWAVCADDGGIPADLTNLSEGQHTLHVRAVDAAGNKDQTPAQYSWTVDLTAPTPSITGAPPALTSNPEITLTFDADEPGVTFECNLNGAGWVPCSTTDTFTGQEGANELLVRATDPAGNTTAPGDEVTFNWTVDTIAPETNIDSGPALFANSDTASFVFSSNDPTATYECRLDTGAWAACAGQDGIPAALTNLSEGQHTLHVRAVDAAGNKDQTPAQYSWTVDLTAPIPSFVSTPGLLEGSPNATFVLSADEVGISFECNLNGDGWLPCDSAQAFVGIEGSNTLEVRATDPAGNTTDAADYATWTWEVDTIAPDTSIIDGPSLYSNVDSAGFEFGSSDPTATFECRLDSGSWAPCADESGIPADFSNLSDGPHTLHVRAVDPAGNKDQVPAQYSWTVDTVAPIPAIAGTPPTLSAQPELTLSFDANESDVTFECNLNGAGWLPCSATETFTGVEGSNTVQVRATDLAGNTTEPADYDSWTWTVDTTPPGTIIATGPRANDSSDSASFTFEPDADIDFFECRLDQGEWVRCAEADGVPADFVDLADGPHTLRVRAVDQAGNRDPSPAVYTWIVDTVPPTTIIEGAPPEFSDSSDAEFAFDSNEDVSRFECSLDTEAGQEVWELCDAFLLIEDLADGPHELKVRAIDLAGNADPDPAVHQWTVDTEEPTVSVNVTPPEVTNSPDVQIDLGSSEPGVTWECSLDGGPWEPCDETITLTDLADGEHELSVRAIDEAGNVSESVEIEWTVDTVAPIPVVVNGPREVDSSDQASFEFESNESPVTWECSLDGGDWFECGETPVFEDLAEGEHELQIRVRDEAGNTSAPIEYNWTVDTTSPVVIITKKPPVLSGSTVDFEFDSNESPVTFECLLDDDPELGQWEACESPLVLKDLADGEHELHIRAVDAAGNVSEVSSFDWDVDHVEVDLLGDADGDGWRDDTGVSGGGCSSVPGSSSAGALLGLLVMWGLRRRREMSA